MSVKKKSKKKKWITIAVVAVVVIAAASMILHPKKPSYESATAATGDITTYYTFSGNIETKNRQTVMADRAMQIKEIYYSEGDKVDDGDVLIKTTMGQRIKAKIDGVVTNISVEEDSQVMAGTALLEVVDNNNLKINVKVDEYDTTVLTAGKKVTVNISAIDKKVTGTVKSMSVQGEIQNGVTYFTAVIDLAKDSSVKIGMSAEVKVVGDEAKGVVTLPMTAILFDDNNNPYVLKKDDKGKIVNNPITTGINDGTVVEIKSGVANGETVYYPSTSKSTNTGFGRRSNNASGGSGD
ncbi:MAG: HlyD family efflux transporter periplasmic adaptor subunit [Eubacteriaceae bacterium]|nr:HlyD family efflux transporter periplasmic adaptor subunit [Eubacteriaceae bacterium]